jgi:hypothetical protein
MHESLGLTEYRDIPSVVVLADSPSGEARARRGVQAAGCRVSAAASIDDASDRLARQVAADAVLAELDGDHGAKLDALLDQLASAASSGRHGIVISAPLALIDRIAARAFHPAVHHLCEPSDAERAMAVGLAAGRRTAWLHDIGKSESTARLQQLSEEVGRIASILAALSEDEAAAANGAGSGEEGVRIEAGQVRTIIRARRMRDHFFKGELFADPAWDMLLDLMAARLEQQRVAVSSLCIAAAVPPTTALRWIKTLCDQGLFVRVADPEDGRRVFIELSDGAAAALAGYLKAVQRLAPLTL